MKDINSLLHSNGNLYYSTNNTSGLAFSNDDCRNKVIGYSPGRVIYG